LTAHYDQTASLEALKSAIDERYGKWAQSGNADLPVKLWRVEPEKFAIQLSASGDGAKSVIYLAFTGTGCKSQWVRD
jgi:hypothetical protein